MAARGHFELKLSDQLFYLNDFSVRRNTNHYVIQHRNFFLKEGWRNEAMNIVICKPPYCGRRAESWVPNPERYSGLLCIANSRSNSTKSPPSGAGNVSEPRHVTSWNSARSHVRIDQCVYASWAVDVPVVSFCLRSSCNHVSGQEDLKTRAEGCRAKW